MFLGNFLIGALQPARQIGLVQAKNLKKLQIFCKKERLDKSAEAYLIEHSEGLESVLEYSLKNYGAFQNENNDLFFKCHKANKELLLLFLKVASPNFDYMTEMLCMVDVYPQVGEFFKRSFQKLSEEDKAKFINQLKPDKSLFCVFWQFVPIEITEVELFEAFLEYYQNQPDVLSCYIRRYNLSEDFQKVLQKKHLWKLIKAYADVHQDFCFSNPYDYCAFCCTGLQIKFCVTVSAEAGIFDDEVLLLSLAAKNFIFNRENKIRFVKLYALYPSEVEAYIAQYGKDICLTEDEQLDVIKENIRLIFTLKDIFFKTEALLFDDENGHTLLEYASQRRFQHHDNEMRFLLMGRKYSKEVEAYYAQYGKDICLTEEEQLDVIKENIRLIFMLNNVSFKIEALLFDDENEHILLEYASQRRFQHHDNEMRFLLTGRKYSKEVEQYLAKYGKTISFTDEELLKFLQNQKNGIEYIRVKSLAMYRDYILPEKRKKLIPYSEEDLPMLIPLSYSNPMILEQFITEHGRVSPQYEAELFFRADEKCREKYIALYGVNLRTLVRSAALYGITKTEQEFLDSIDFEQLPINFTLLSKWKIFRKHSFDEMSTCKLGEKIYGGCTNIESCHYCMLLEKILTIVLPMLQNIADRNYLQG